MGHGSMTRKGCRGDILIMGPKPLSHLLTIIALDYSTRGADTKILLCFYPIKMIE